MKLFSAIRERVDKASKNAEYRAMRFVDTLNVDHPIVKDTVERIESAYADTARLLEAVDLTVEAMSKFQHPRWDTEEFAETEDGYNLLQALQKIQELSDKCK